MQLMHFVMHHHAEIASLLRMSTLPPPPSSAGCEAYRRQTTLSAISIDRHQLSDLSLNLCSCKK